MPKTIFGKKGYTPKLLSQWIAAQRKKGKEEFTLEEMCKGIGYDYYDTRWHNKVYNTINGWRNKAAMVWLYLKKQGELTQKDFAERWKQFLDVLNEKHGYYYFLYDRRDVPVELPDGRVIKMPRDVYVQPEFDDKEELDQRRLIWKAQSFRTVLAEMGEYGETLTLTGRPVPEALKKWEGYTKKYITDETYKELEASKEEGSGYTEEEKKTLKSMKDNNKLEE